MDDQILKHIRFNADGDVLCGGAHGSKDIRAKRVYLRATGPTRRLQPDEGTYLVGKDDRKVSIDDAVCGQHLRGSSFPVSIAAAHVAEFRTAPEALLDYAVRVYDNEMEQRAARDKARNDHYAESLRSAYDRITFTVEPQEPRADMKAGWQIVGHDTEGRDAYPLANISVADDMGSGRLWLQQSEYLNSGPGKGTRAYLAAYMDALQRAATFIDQQTYANASAAE